MSQSPTSRMKTRNTYLSAATLVFNIDASPEAADMAMFDL